MDGGIKSNRDKIINKENLKILKIMMIISYQALTLTVL